MTVQNPAIFLQAGSHPAEDVRRLFSTLVPTEGVYGATALKVTEKSGTTNMSVDVAGGRAFIAGDEATYQGLYFVENRGTQNVVISAADASLDRIDRIVAVVHDAAYSGATSEWDIEVVTGTPAVTPIAPDVPDNAILLATINVAASAASITNSDITDARSASSLWKAPRGDLGLAERTSNVAVVTTETDVTNLSLALNVEEGRYIYLIASANCYNDTANGGARLHIKEGATQLLRRGGANPLASQDIGIQCEVRLAPSAGAHTYKVSLNRAGSTGSAGIAASADNPAYLRAVDVGGYLA